MVRNVSLKLNLLSITFFNFYPKRMGLNLGCSRNIHEFSPDVRSAAFGRCEIPTHSHLHFHTRATRISRILHTFVGATCITRHGVVTLEWKRPRKRKIKGSSTHGDEGTKERAQGEIQSRGTLHHRALLPTASSLSAYK